MIVPERAIKAVLFDLDDTLNDRSASWKQFLTQLRDQKLLNEADLGGGLDAAHKLVIKEDRGGHREKSELFAVLSSALAWTTTMDAAKLEAIWRESFPACITPREGLIETLTTLKKKKKLKLGIVSNGQTIMQNQKIDAMKIRDLIDVISISEAVGFKKPERGIFDATLAPMKVLPEQTLFVGDNPEFDIHAASSIGMRTAWMSNGKRWPANLQPRPNFTIASLAEVLESLVVSPFPTPMFRPSY